MSLGARLRALVARFRVTGSVQEAPTIPEPSIKEAVAEAFAVLAEAKAEIEAAEAEAALMDAPPPEAMALPPPTGFMGVPLDQSRVDATGHVDSASCWCQPRLSYVDRAHGIHVWQHKREIA